MYIFTDRFKYNDPLNIVFLCGSRYRKTKTEKRNVLKKHLEDNVTNCHVIILEENFNFRNTTRSHLAYDDIFLFSLAHVEELASLFADSIIIIHETISTAAELGMFANNPAILKRICLLTPDPYSVEEEKVSSFIRLAFLQHSSPETTIGKHITFFPDTEIFLDSPKKSGYYTYFHNNSIGEHLSRNILSFVKRESTPQDIVFRKSQYNKPLKSEYSVDYSIDGTAASVNVYVHPNTLKLQLLSMFLLEDVQKEIKQNKKIAEHVSYIQSKYMKLLSDSIAYYSGKALADYSLAVSVKNTACTLRQAIGYFIYMLQAIDFVRMQVVNDKDLSSREICITNQLEALKEMLSPVITEQAPTAFGGLNL